MGNMDRQIWEDCWIRSAIGDSHASLFGHGCVERGDCMAGHGTGTCVLMNIGEEPLESQNGLNTTVAWRMNGKTVYALEGVVNYAGAVTTWLKDGLELVSCPEETEELACRADPGDHTYLVPAFTGIGAPYWDDGASACFVGMSRLTGRDREHWIPSGRYRESHGAGYGRACQSGADGWGAYEKSLFDAISE